MLAQFKLGPWPAALYFQTNSIATYIHFCHKIKRRATLTRYKGCTISKPTNQKTRDSASSVPLKQLNLKSIFRIAVAIATAAAIGYLLYKSADQLTSEKIEFSKIDFRWWCLSIMVYFCSMMLSSIFWHRVLIAFKQAPTWRKSTAAFFTSQLGKYVPGKAMVVVIRTDMIRGDHVNTKPAAASVFVETLTWIFTGAAIASLLMIFRFPEFRVLQVTAAAMTIAAGVLTWPPIFQKIATRISSIGKNKSKNIFSGLTLKTMATGWLLLAIGWCLNGASLWLVLKGLPGTEIAYTHYWLALACVSLATVAGFVSLLPGGIGVRELVMIPLLGPAIGPVNAIVAAVVIRIVWLAAELIGAGAFFTAGKLDRNRLGQPSETE